MQDIILSILPYKVLAGHVLIGLILIALLFRRSFGAGVAAFLGKHALALAFLVSLGAVFGSLFYSEVVGFEPCVLCWWQRALIFPSAIILGIAAWKKDRSIFAYIVPLVVASAVIASYQYYSAFLGGTSILSCTDAEGACSKIYVNAFGYITIELMSLTVSVLIILLAWANRIYKNENSNS